MTHLLTGRSAECDHPADVRDLPVVTSARIDSDALSGAEIDQAVRDAVLDGSSLYAVDAELIRELDPDLVITQDLCRVCAVSTDEVRRIEALDCDVLALDPHTIAEIEQSVHTVAERLGCPERRRAGGRRDAADDRPRRRPRSPGSPAAGCSSPSGTTRRSPAATGCPRWSRWPAASTCWARRARRRVPVTWDDVAAAEPELVIVAPCGFDAARAARETPAWDGCPAVCVDANAYYSRPAPRIAAGRRPAGAPAAPGGRARPGHAGDQARVNRATHSMWCVCGNMSTGWTRSSR